MEDLHVQMANSKDTKNQEKYKILILSREYGSCTLWHIYILDRFNVEQYIHFHIKKKYTLR